MSTITPPNNNAPKSMTGSPVFADQQSPQWQRSITGSSQVGESSPTSTDRSPFPLVSEATIGDLSNLQRIYRELDGNELTEAIGEHVKQQVMREMRQSGKIEGHLMYSKPAWKGEIYVKWSATANNAISLRVEGSVDKEVEVKSELINDAPETASTVALPEHLDSNAAPDDIRAATNQPIPVMLRSGEGKSQGVVRVAHDTFKKGNQGNRK